MLVLIPFSILHTAVQILDQKTKRNWHDWKVNHAKFADM